MSLYCKDCDESYPSSAGTRCETCDAILERVTPAQANPSSSSATPPSHPHPHPHHSNPNRIHFPFGFPGQEGQNILEQFYRELLGEDLFEEISRNIQGQDPKRKIDVDYIKKAGKNLSQTFFLPVF